MTATTWHVSRESTEWVGPIVVSLTAGGAPTTGTVEFAVLPRYARPESDDWASPDLDPDSPGTAKGVLVAPVTDPGRYGIWVRVTDNPETPVLEPPYVGWIQRT